MSAVTLEPSHPAPVLAFLASHPKLPRLKLQRGQLLPTVRESQSLGPQRSGVTPEVLRSRRPQGSPRLIPGPVVKKFGTPPCLPSRVTQRPEVKTPRAVGRRSRPDATKILRCPPRQRGGLSPKKGTARSGPRGDGSRRYPTGTVSGDVESLGLPAVIGTVGIELSLLNDGKALRQTDAAHGPRGKPQSHGASRRRVPQAGTASYAVVARPEDGDARPFVGTVKRVVLSVGWSVDDSSGATRTTSETSVVGREIGRPSIFLDLNFKAQVT